MGALLLVVAGDALNHNWNDRMNPVPRHYTERAFGRIELMVLPKTYMRWGEWGDAVMAILDFMKR